EGQYDTGNYTLDLSQPAGSNEHLVRFYRKTFMLQQLKRLDDSSQNELRLYLPVGTVLDLDIAINKGEADVDLSRVPVRQLSLRFSKGKLNLEFKQLNPVELETMIVEASMGEAQLHGLGFARAREIRLGGSMGDFVFEFDGPLEADSRASIRVRMGNGQVRIPSETLVSLVDSSVFLGHLENRRGWSHENPENMPALDLDLSVSFGEIVVR
ncbi:MAG: hypothetical protein JSV80_09890, partial [Acidobacteriota bacterium]